ncbi:hypothetical protein [[Clostridium] fimetarium]|uniref:Uncharacterized protein n=1 Tax=[Clostridium] fimetarium TaxID=99656 RepID=A0A1I0QVZ9_9FIRM|nr:hypothetical protein [[Clostridium] fimetarium]SEW31887.1 hypothetical protein SAMN05421659_109195 [[Clostridium] fimetarium]
MDKSSISPDAIVAVIGALAGTVLGWVLNSLSNMGRLKINITNVETSFLKKGFEKSTTIPSAYDQEPDYIKISVTVKLYNGSNKTCGINNIHYQLKVNHKKYDLDCIMQGTNELINVEPYKFIEKLIYHMNSCKIDDIASKKMKNSYKLYLKYNISGKRRVKRKLIAK